jgi:hypothetical protein
MLYITGSLNCGKAPHRKKIPNNPPQPAVQLCSHAPKKHTITCTLRNPRTEWKTKKCDTYSTTSVLLSFSIRDSNGLLGDLDTLCRSSRRLLEDHCSIVILADHNNTTYSALGSLNLQPLVELILRVAEQSDIGQVLLGLELLIGSGQIAGKAKDGISRVLENGRRIPEGASLSCATRSGGCGSNINVNAGALIYIYPTRLWADIPFG